MKSLDALNTELTAELKARCKRVIESNLSNLLSPAELQTFYRQNVVNEKFMELWEIVTLLDSYLQMPSRHSIDVREQLREMIDKL